MIRLTEIKIPKFSYVVLNEANDSNAIQSKKKRYLLEELNLTKRKLIIFTKKKKLKTINFSDKKKTIFFND